MKTLLLLLVLATPAQAQSLTVTTVASPATVKAGGTSTVTVTLENALTPRPPFEICAGCDFEDEYGVAGSSTPVCKTIQIIQPVKPKRYWWTATALFDYVVGSAKVDSVPVTPTVSGSVVSIALDKTLNEGQKLEISYVVKAK